MNRKTERAHISSPRGVTLVELMVVIVVLGVLAALVSPSIFTAMRRQKAAGVARDLTNELRRARNQAMTRGEVIVVEICGGTLGACEKTSEDQPTETTLISYATGHRDETGVYQRGDNACGAACTVDTDCAPDERCDTLGGSVCVPKGATCRGGQIYSKPARNCRDWDPAEDFLREVTRLDMAQDDSANMVIHGFSPDQSFLCFNPDGRVVLPRGLAIAGGGAEVCEGENWAMWVARDDVTIAGEAACTASVDDREPLNLYKIVVPYNGAIKMRQ